MKWIGLILVLVLLSASQATSQVSDDNLIVPGQRIGKWRVEMTIANLVQMNGRATTIATVNPVDYVLPLPERHNWNQLGFAAFSRDGQKVDFLLVYSPNFKTDKGVGPGSDRGAVLNAYGPPTAEIRIAAPGARMVYDAIGFAAGLEGDTMVGSFVFRPGTGKSLWRF